MLKVTLSPEDRTQKTSDLQHENSLINAKNTTELSVEEFMNYTVAPYSRTWSGSVLKGSRKNSNFISTQIIALDIDNKVISDSGYMTPEKAITRCREYGILPTFIYSSFSHTEELPRFRIVFVLDEVIDDSLIAGLANQTIRDLFPESDNITDVSRMWFGGKEILFENTDYSLPLKTVYELSLLHSIPANGRNARRAIEASMNKWSKNGIPLYSNIGDAQISTDFTPRHREKLEKFDWDFAKGQCSLLRKLLDGTEKVWHNDLLLLASNMFRIKGGEKRYKEAILNHPLIDNEKTNIMHYIKFRWGTPQTILPISFSRIYSHLEEDKAIAESYTNLLDVRPVGQYSKARFIGDPTVPMPTDEARARLRSEFERCYEEEGTDIYLFKCATGLGKSSLAIQKEDIALFFPNHALKDEKSNETTVYHDCTPKLPDSLPENLRVEYETLCTCGLYEEALTKLSEHLQTPTFGGTQIADDIIYYLEQNRKCTVSDRAIYSTHSRGTITDYTKHNTYVFDEDPLQQLVRFEQITTKDLRIVGRALEAKGSLADARIILEISRQLKLGIGAFLEDLNLPVFRDREMIVNVISSNKERLSGDVCSFLLSETPPKFVVDFEDALDPEGERIIFYVNYRPLLDDKKYIILSATVDEWIYKKLYGDRVKVVDLSHVESKGNVIQFSDRSFSRTAMRDETRLREVNSFLTELDAITFLRFRDSVTNASNEIYFGKTEGFNSLTNRDIKVVGTFHLSTMHYVLLAKFLGVNYRASDLELRKMVVEYNGFRFNFFTYENPELRHIQFYFIGKEMKQAVGRARLIDNKKTVFIFSNYPLEGAKQYNLKDAPIVAEEYRSKVA